MAGGGETVKFRKKPLVVEARQAETYADTIGIEQWVNANGGLVHRRTAEHGQGIECLIDTLEGPHVVSPGDWVIRGVNGEFYACNPDVFALTYEPVEDTTDAPTE